MIRLVDENNHHKFHRFSKKSKLRLFNTTIKLWSSLVTESS